MEARGVEASPVWAPGLRVSQTEERMEKGRGRGQHPSVVSRRASATWAGTFGAGRLSVQYREMGSLGAEEWEEDSNRSLGS